MGRPLTERERAVLDALLDGCTNDVANLRLQVPTLSVGDPCRCGCPSADFEGPSGPLTVHVDARIEGSIDTVFLYSVEGRLGGIEYVTNADRPPNELPDPTRLRFVDWAPAHHLGPSTMIAVDRASRQSGALDDDSSA